MRGVGDTINAHKYLNNSCQKNGTTLLSVVPSNRTRGKRQKLMHRKFHLNLRKKSFTVENTDRESVDSPSLEIFKT